MLAKIQGAQRDFSAGQLDVSNKRADENPNMKAGARQMINWRIRNSKTLKNRPGRTALFLETGRVEEIRMSVGNNFFLVFGNQVLRVYNSAGSKVYDSGPASMPWTLASLSSIVWDVYQFNVYICFTGHAPQVLTWDGNSTWSIANYAEEVIGGTQKRTPFYRISPLGVTMQPSGTTGSVTLTFSTGMNLVAGHVGTRMRFINCQLLITAVTNSTTATATCEQPLYPGQRLDSNAVDTTTIFFIGDVIVGKSSGAKGIVTGYSGVGNAAVHVQLMQGAGIQAETVVGPNGYTAIVGGAIEAPNAVTAWDDEVINSFRGYPGSCFIDQGRLGLCNFPAVPSLIVWSAIGTYTDLYTDSNNAGPDNAINEIAPGKSQVLFVVPGPESSEFVFCDNGVYYIPITATNPLKPGSVAFNLLSRDGSANVQPRVLQETIVWLNAGLTSVLAVVAPGAYYRPYEVRNISEFHGELLHSPIAITVPSTTSQFEERYVYILNNDGTAVVGKYNVQNGQIVGVVGWVPWNGSGTINWLSSYGADVIFSTTYTPNGIAAVNVVERLDDTQYLDCAMSVNAAPAAFAPPGGKGPLWWLAGGTVSLIDNSTRMMGTYTIDANGFIVPQNNGGENLASATLVAGQEWTATLEPFAPDAPPGPASHQRMFKRRVARMAVYVVNSSGFEMARLFSGPITATSPALGTVMNFRLVPAWNQGDDPTQPPPLREEVQRWRPLGRSFDPRVAVIKDTPGPLEVLEFGIEASI